MKKALITGITGQDGSYLAEFLLEKGYEVHGILRRSSSFNTGRIEHLYLEEWIKDMSKNRAVNLHYGDMTDSSSLIRIIQQVKPDEIQNANLLRILKNRGTQQLFIGEAGQDKKISAKQVEQAKKGIQQHNQRNDNFRKENMPDYRAVNYNENTPARYLNKLLSDTLISLLYENNQDQERNKQKKGQRELEYELEKKKRQHQKHGRSSGSIYR